jgi:hypothetical protein
LCGSMPMVITAWPFVAADRDNPRRAA